MKRLARMMTVASTLALALLLSNCSSFDPTDIMDNLFASQKKPLPGDRKPLFPSGTPGVSQGLPPELVKGYQPPPPAEPVQNAQDTSDRPKPKPKPKPNVAAAPPANPPSAPPAAPTRSSQSSPWPDPPQSRQSAAPAWPDPPAPGTVTR
jgi:outer membrane biosynthesis protein TonB